MKPLSSDDERALRLARKRAGWGLDLTPADLADMRSEWAPRVMPDGKDEEEHFALCRPDGSTTAAVGPRWLFHLFGLCHRAVHVGLSTPAGLVILQRRSPTMADWPGAWDMAVAGHVPQRDDGSDMGYEAAARKEAFEELGLPLEGMNALFAEGRLVPIGAPYASFEQDEGRNPPFYNAESRQLYGATLTPEGYARLVPDYEELSGVFVCSREEAWSMLERATVAGAMRHSLTRYLDWLVQPRA
ncbi:MAG: NUDIX domain-containing protein [Chthonomonadales bacterium]|nr:NUDIX domain-containing protein [Chthonomonadales bacterium]